MNRRTMLKGLGWAAPAMTIATAAPAVAASRLENRLRFTNVTATVGKEPNTIYANTRVAVVDGPDPVTNLEVVIAVEGFESNLWTQATLPGWGATELLKGEWVVSGRGKYVVTFTAAADGVEPITASVVVEAPGWWFK